MAGVGAANDICIKGIEGVGMTDGGEMAKAGVETRGRC